MVDFCVGYTINDCQIGVTALTKNASILKCIGGALKKVGGGVFEDMGMREYKCDSNVSVPTAVWLPTEDDDGEVGATHVSLFGNATRCCPLLRKEDEQAVLTIGAVFLALFLLPLVVSLVLCRKKVDPTIFSQAATTEEASPLNPTNSQELGGASAGLLVN